MARRTGAKLITIVQKEEKEDGFSMLISLGIASKQIKELKEGGLKNEYITKEIVYDMAEMIEKLGVSSVIKIIKHPKYNKSNPKSFLFVPNHEHYEKVLSDEEKFLNSEYGIQGLPCRSCKSENTITKLKQVRSADEGMTAFTFCYGCKTQTKTSG